MVVCTTCECCVSLFYAIYRAAEKNLLEFSGVLSIDGDVLQGQTCIPYKYYVTGTERPSEFLHGAKSLRNETVHRCLQIPAESFRHGGEIQIHKVMIFRLRLISGTISLNRLCPIDAYMRHERVLPLTTIDAYLRKKMVHA